jgi:hypothetical protein
MEAARLIKSKNPHSMVEVKDLEKWRCDCGGLGQGERWLLSSAPDRARLRDRQGPA